MTASIHGALLAKAIISVSGFAKGKPSGSKSLLAPSSIHRNQTNLQENLR